MKDPSERHSNVVTPFDHAVLNCRYDLDAAQSFFTALGFRTTTRGQHSLGSINHLIVFRHHYFEIVGVDRTESAPRKELIEARTGLNGLVFRSQDIDGLREHLRAKEVPANASRSFSRDVVIGQELREARFRTVSVAHDYFPIGRLYFCEHMTPELIWTDANSLHKNTAVALRELRYASFDPVLHSQRVEHAAGGTRVDCRAIVNSGVAIAFVPDVAAACSDRKNEDTTRTDQYKLPTLVSFYVKSLDIVKNILEKSQLESEVSEAKNSVVVSGPRSLGVFVEFVERV